MLNLKSFSILTLVTFMTVGCASNKHSRMSGSVAMKISESKGVACLFGEGPKVGDDLTIFENVCSDERIGGGGKEGAGPSSCKMVKTGTATISRMINDHYAEFETNQKVAFDEGYIIELSK